MDRYYLCKSRAWIFTLEDRMDAAELAELLDATVDELAGLPVRPGADGYLVVETANALAEARGEAPRWPIMQSIEVSAAAFNAAVRKDIFEEDRVAPARRVSSLAAAMPSPRSKREYMRAYMREYRKKRAARRKD